MKKSVLLELKDYLIIDPASRRPLIGKVDLEVVEGMVYLLSGPNGVGKSSLIKSLTAKRATHCRGEVKKISDLKMVFHPQISAPMFALPLTLSDILSWANELSDEASKLVGDLNLNRPWDSCSGGERQRVLLSLMFTKAIFETTAPTLMILDEPMNHLDELSQKHVISAIRNWLDRGSKRAVILVSHEKILDLQSEVLTLEPAAQRWAQR